MLCHCAFLSLQAAANATVSLGEALLLLILILLLIFRRGVDSRKDHEQDHEQEKT
jgi:hypothetical protein